jgi:hypothetical protein
VVAAGIIAQQLVSAARGKGRDEQIQIAVAIVIPRGGRPVRSQSKGRNADTGEAAVLVVAIQRSAAGGRQVHIEEAIVVEIRPNVGQRHVGVRRQRTLGYLDHLPSVVAEQLGRQAAERGAPVGNKEIEIAVVVVVDPVDALPVARHDGVGAGGNALQGGRSGFLQQILVEEVAAQHSACGSRADEQVHVAVVIEVAPGAVRIGREAGHGIAGGHAGEGVIGRAVVQKQQVVQRRISGEARRMRHEQVQVAVVVDVHPGRRPGADILAFQSSRRDGGEFAAVVSEYRGSARCVQVRIAVVVVVAPGDSDHWHGAGKHGGRGLREVAVSIVAEQPALLASGRTARQEQVEIAVTVEVDPRHAGGAVSRGGDPRGSRLGEANGAGALRQAPGGGVPSQNQTDCCAV